MKCHALLLFTVSVVTAAEPPPVKVLQGFDPVELAAGREVAGQEKLTEVRGRYLYQFATEENRRTFAAQAERYAVQFGGACMKMGALSGKGSP